MEIRQERREDWEAVYRLVREAFASAEQSDGNEQDLVTALRESAAFVPELSLVAVDGERIVGHILFTRVTVGGTQALALAPLSVLPEEQGKGIGLALIREGHRIAGRLGYDPDVLAEQLDSLGLAGQELRLLVNSENEAKASAAQLIAYQLDSAGLTVQVEQLSYEDYTAALTRGDFDLYLGETVLTADFDLSPLLSSSGSLNFGRWQNSETDALLSAMHTARPGDGKQQAAQALFTQLEQQMPLAPLLFKNGSVLTQWGRLTQLNPLRNNVFYQFENWNIQ